MRHHARCRRCGERVDFLPIPGFRRPGEPKYYAVNKDDHQPHFKRCKITLALREQRRLDRLPKNPSAKQKGSRAKPETLSSTEGVQLDAFDYS